MKYWVYLNGEIPGSYAPDELAAIPGFAETSMVCPADVQAEQREWRRAGTYPDLIDALKQRPAPPPPGPEAPLPRNEELGIPKTPDDILSDASNSIFRHVTHLMTELESRREEKALTRQLQREVTRLKAELGGARERINALAERAELIPDYEARLKDLMERADRRQVELRDKEASLIDLRRRLDGQRLKLEAAARAEMGLNQDLKRQSIVAEELSKQVAEKEILLAKSFAVIRRLESTLRGVIPDVPAEPTLGEYREAEPPPEPAAAEPAVEEKAAPEPVIAAAAPLIEPIIEEAPPAPADPAAEVESVPEPETPPPAPAPTPEPPHTPAEEGEALAEPEDNGLDIAPPPEGDQPPITPVAPPWQDKLARFASFLRDKLGLH